MTDLRLDPADLKRLHRILRQKTDLESRIRRCPLRAKVAQQKVTDAQSKLDELKEGQKKTRMLADQRQLQLNEREARVKDLMVKRNACESNREYQLLSDQIAADEQANSVGADEIFELLERLDAMEASIQTAEQAVAKAQDDAAEVQQGVDSELNVLQADLAVVLDELREAERVLGGEVRDKYSRLVDSIGEDALSPVEDECCGHCHTTQTSQVISELLMNRVVFCRSCGSLLYLGNAGASTPPG